MRSRCPCPRDSRSWASVSPSRTPGWADCCRTRRRSSSVGWEGSPPDFPPKARGPPRPPTAPTSGRSPGCRSSRPPPVPRRRERVLGERDQRVELASLDEFPAIGIGAAIGRVFGEDQVPAAAGIGIISRRVLEPAQVEDARVGWVGTAGRRRQGREGRLRQRVDQLDEEPVGRRRRPGTRKRTRVPR